LIAGGPPSPVRGAAAMRSSIAELEAELRGLECGSEQGAAVREEGIAAAPEPAKAAPDASICCVCLDSERTCVFVPCGHKCACRGCADAIMATEQNCPLCRTACTVAVTVFE
jgi:hypothetical protein